MYVSKAARKDIAGLINALETEHIMRQRHDSEAPGYYLSEQYQRSKRKVIECTLLLGDKYGIILPNYENFKDESK